jgi:hypothetical protein
MARQNRPPVTFFTVEVLSWRGLVTYYVLFFLHLESYRVSVAGITRHPDKEWMEQIARSATPETWGYLTSHQNWLPRNRAAPGSTRIQHLTSDRLERFCESC